MAIKKKQPGKPTLITLTYQPPGPELSNQVQSLFASTDKMIVIDADGSAFAQQQLTEVKKLKSKVSEARLKITRPMDEAKRETMALFEPMLQKLDLIIRDISRKVISYDDRVKQEAREKQRLADEAAERERQAALRKAEKARAKGDDAAEQRALLKAESVVAPVFEAESPKLKGRAFVETFTFEIVDESKLKREYMTPDLVTIGKLVRALGDKKLAEEAVGAGAICVTSSRDVRG